jgi:dolichol-phosphate mannosyltransferase
LKRAAAAAAKFFRRIILGDITKDSGCALRIFKREALSALPNYRNFHRFFTFLVRINGFSVKEVPVGHRKREFGKSKYGVFRRAKEGIFDLFYVARLKREAEVKISKSQPF